MCAARRSHRPEPGETELPDKQGPLSDAEIAARLAHAATEVERRRWQVIALLAAEARIPAIVAATGYSTRAIRQIAQRYRESGPTGLADRRRLSPGATPLLSPAQQRGLKQLLQSAPPDGGTWTGPKVARWITATTGQCVHRQRGWEYLRRFGPPVDTARDDD